ncbi:unnamed protein product [Ambrosiozyma monospora]|uniref:Unnamed protein product n=1 Tax=Ambrosiozyma monospora TaxID=43982 RepID=A0A9W7DCI8_AMBMO|nr:unnamed protein product [Ambrosiozyma monospora]
MKSECRCHAVYAHKGRNTSKDQGKFNICNVTKLFRTNIFREIVGLTNSFVEISHMVNSRDLRLKMIDDLHPLEADFLLYLEIMFSHQCQLRIDLKSDIRFGPRELG